MAAPVPPAPPIPEDPEGAFLYVLEHVIGLDTPAKRDRVTNAGFLTADDLLLVDTNSIVECLNNNIPIMVKAKMKTLKKWAEDEYDVEGTIDVRKFTPEICKEKQRNIARSATTASSDKAIATKEKLSVFTGKLTDWLNAKRELTAYLNQIKNEQGVPIYYVIRDPDQEEKYREDNGIIGKNIYEAPFRGRIYEADAFQVLQILRQWTAKGSTAQTFVDNNNDVQEAWAQLIRHYEGHDARSSNIQKAREVIMTAHWIRNTQNFTFNDYCNKHVRANNELDRYNSNVDGESQVNAFLKGIRADGRLNPQLLPIKAIIVNNENTRNNLSNAIVAFKDTMRQIMGTTSERDHRFIGSANRLQNRDRRVPQGRGQLLKGRGRYHGSGRGYQRHNQTSHQGRGRTNDRDSNLYIPNHILESLGPRYRTMILRGREQMERETTQGPQANTTTSNTNPTPRNVSEVQSSQVSEITNEDNHHNGSNTTSYEGGASSLFGSEGRKKRNRNFGAITSSTRRIARTITIISTPTDFNKRARAEIDTRADTLCAGSTFLLHESTGKVVDVSGFHDSLDPIKNIQVGTCITAIDLDGETIIASFPQSLYFGASMENSLVPPAQLWHYGITVDVVPKQYSDGHSLHGIHHPDENIFIPFHLYGCISYFSTRLPTNDEITSCRWITFTSDAEWEPYSDSFADAERAMIRHHDTYDPRHLHYDHHGKPLDGRSLGAITSNHLLASMDLTCLNPALDTFDTTYSLSDIRSIHATSSKEHRSSVPVDVLARRWGTSTTTAADTLQKTTQRGIRYLQGDLSRRFRTRQRQLNNRYLNTRMYTDTFFKDRPSARGNTCFQLFVTAEGFATGKPMQHKSEAADVLEYVCREYGIPRLLVSDNAKEETLGSWGRITKSNLIRQQVSEPHSSWQNLCEGEIREIRKHYVRIMALHRCPDAFWDFGYEYVLKLRQLLVRSAAGHRPPIETLTGETPDTSEFMEFDFYQWIKFRDAHDTKDDPIKLGRWLGVAHTVGSALTYWILKDNGQVICRSTVRPLLPAEINNDVEKDLRTKFDLTITDKYGIFDPALITVFDNDDMEQPLVMADDDQDIRDISLAREHPEEHDQVRGPDLFHNAEIYLPHGDRNEIARVIGRKRNADGNYIGRAHKNPRLDSRIFTVRFADGEEKDISFNILAEHLYSQVDSEGNQHRLFREIINHRRRSNAVDKADQFRIKDGRRVPKQTVAGWDLEVEWKDGTTSWLPLKELKETDSVETAHQYAKHNNIIDEPAFAWWAPHVIRKAKRLIKLSKSRHIRSGYKFGIRIPRNVEEALAFDKEDGSELWFQAIMKEMNNVRIAFEKLDEHAKPPPGYKKVELMMIFDVKLDFTRKARLVARGDLTAPPPTLTLVTKTTRMGGPYDQFLEYTTYTLSSEKWSIRGTWNKPYEIFSRKCLLYDLHLYDLFEQYEVKYGFQYDLYA